jgi:hypothetical protein
MRRMYKLRRIRLILLPVGSFGLGFVIGIVPGLLLGLLGGHTVGAAIGPILLAFVFVNQRARKHGDVDWVAYAIAVFMGLGLGFSIWAVGNVIS